MCVNKCQLCAPVITKIVRTCSIYRFSYIIRNMCLVYVLAQTQELITNSYGCCKKTLYLRSSDLDLLC